MKKNLLINKIQVLVLLFFLPVYSCNTDNSGYKISETGLKYKYLKKNSTGINIKISDYVEIKLVYTNSKDSVLFNSNEISNTIKMQVKKSNYNSSFEEALLMLRTGEHALFKIQADLFFLKTKKTKIPQWVKKGELLTFNIELIKVLDSNEIKKEQEAQNQRKLLAENKNIEQYIKDNNIKVKAFYSGLFYIEKDEGKGQQAKLGDILEVHYIGKFIDGRVFDSSISRNETFMFKLGNSEVIAGWEEGFSKMKKGGKAKFIIPSQLAYGKKGYSKIIPPYSTLVFDVELINISK